jgi:hypothetical protein
MFFLRTRKVFAPSSGCSFLITVRSFLQPFLVQTVCPTKFNRKYWDSAAVFLPYDRLDETTIEVTLQYMNTVQKKAAGLVR